MPPPWVERTDRISWKITKDLNPEKYDTTTEGSHINTTKQDVRGPVYPLGDFRVSERALARRLDSLMGTVPKVEKRETQNADQLASARPKTDAEKWDIDRNRSKIISEETATVAMKRDGSAWSDVDGYTKVPEPPSFRDGFNSTLRVLPAQEEHLHNGLKLNSEKMNPVSEIGHSIAPSVILSNRQSEVVGVFEKHSRSIPDVIKRAINSDAILRLSLKPEISAALANFFVKGVSLGVTASKSRDVHAFVSLFRHEHSTVELDGLGATGEANEHAREVVPLAENARRQEAELTRALGNAFLSLGLTLPAGKRDDPLRNDSVALEMGSRVMLAVEAHKEAPSFIEPSLRKEVAVALGRALLHIQNAAGISASRGKTVSDSAQKDRTLKAAVGRLTLHLLETTASRSGKTLTRDPLRREILANALGSAVIQMDRTSLASASLKHASDRNSEERPQLNKPAKPQSTVEMSSKTVPELRVNKIRDHLVRRPLLPGAEAPPASIPRYMGSRA